jgi:RAMP superfamily
VLCLHRRAPQFLNPDRSRAARPHRRNRSRRPLSDFVNPYNFLPAVPRDKVPPDSEFRDRAPVGHDHLRADHFTGTIRVTLTTVTPLLIPDAAQASENGDGHKTFPVRLGSDGKTPYLAPTAVKGMLRAAYEAVTNSRLGVFAGSSRTRGDQRLVTALAWRSDFPPRPA